MDYFDYSEEESNSTQLENPKGLKELDSLYTEYESNGTTKQTHLEKPDEISDTEFIYQESEESSIDGAPLLRTSRKSVHLFNERTEKIRKCYTDEKKNEEKTEEILADNWSSSGFEIPLECDSISEEEVLPEESINETQARHMSTPIRNEIAHPTNQVELDSVQKVLSDYERKEEVEAEVKVEEEEALLTISKRWRRRATKNNRNSIAAVESTVAIKKNVIKKTWKQQSPSPSPTEETKEPQMMKKKTARASEVERLQLWRHFSDLIEREKIKEFEDRPNVLDIEDLWTDQVHFAQFETS